ncbi:MAG: DUF411 domain-containing protein [Pseudomonas sp.]|nr:DUF411 domain-containing protein [Pseudomonas sp.]
MPRTTVRSSRLLTPAALGALFVLAACQGASSPASAQSATAAATAATAAAGDRPPAAEAASTSPVAALPLVTVHKSPTCGCCGLWVEHMQQAGFTVEVIETDEVGAVKERVGVPYGKGSCHTAEVGGYFVEGHVPADDIKRLLAEKPDAKGLTVPGMPLGSPGMEVPDGRVQRYETELVGRDGGTTTFAVHGEAAAQ